MDEGHQVSKTGLKVQTGSPWIADLDRGTEILHDLTKSVMGRSKCGSRRQHRATCSMLSPRRFRSKLGDARPIDCGRRLVRLAGPVRERPSPCFHFDFVVPVTCSNSVGARGAARRIRRCSAGRAPSDRNDVLRRAYACRSGARLNPPLDAWRAGCEGGDSHRLRLNGHRRYCGSQLGGDAFLLFNPEGIEWTLYAPMSFIAK